MASVRESRWKVHVRRHEECPSGRASGARWAVGGNSLLGIRLLREMVIRGLAGPVERGRSQRREGFRVVEAKVGGPAKPGWEFRTRQVRHVGPFGGWRDAYERRRGVRCDMAFERGAV